MVEHLSRRVARAQFGRPVVGRLIGPRGTPGALSAAACASDGEVARRGRRERRVRPHALRGRLAAGESGGARRAVAMCADRTQPCWGGGGAGGGPLRPDFDLGSTRAEPPGLIRPRGLVFGPPLKVPTRGTRFYITFRCFSTPPCIAAHQALHSEIK